MGRKHTNDSIAAGIVVLTSALTMAGWLLHVEWLVRLGPGEAVMQFSTALGMLIAACAVLLAQLGAHRAKLGVAVALVFLCAWSTYGYLAGTAIWLDTLVGTPFVADRFSPPGRSSLFTLAGLLGIAVSVFMLAGQARRSWQTTTAAVAACIALGIGATAVIGFLASHVTGLDWGRHHGTSAQTALCLTLLGGAQLALAWRRAPKGQTGYPAAFPVPVAVAVLAATAVTVHSFSNLEHQTAIRFASAKVEESAGALENRFSATEDTVYRIASILAEQQDITQEEWTAATKGYLTDLPGLLAFELESNGSRRHASVPGYTGTLHADAWDIAFAGEGPDARGELGLLPTARETAHFYVAAAAHGSHGQQLRILALFDLPAYLNRALSPSTMRDFAISLKYGARQLYLRSVPELADDELVAHVHPGGDDWELRMTPTLAYVRSRQTALPWTMAGAGGLVALLMALSTHLAVIASARSVDLQMANRAVERSRQRMARLVGSLPDAVFTVAGDGKVEDANPAAESIFAASTADLLGRNVEDFLSPSEAVAIKLRDTRRVEGMNALTGGSFDAQAQRVNGAPFTAAIRVSEFESEDGTKYVWTIRDITWRREAEKERERLVSELKALVARNRELAARYSALVGCSSVGMTAVSPDGVFTECNEAFARIVGYSVDELMHKSFRKLNHPEDDGKTTGFIAEMKEGKRESYNYVKRYIRKDAGTVWVDVTGAALRDEQGRVVEVVGITLDVTERLEISQSLERAVAAAKENAVRFETLVASAPDATVMVDEQGDIVEYNRQAEHLFGWARNEALAMKVEALLPEHLRDAHVGQREAYLRNPEIRAMGVGRELYALNKSGAVVPVEVTLSPVRMSGHVMVVASVRDITERREAQQAILQSEHRLRQVNKELESIVYVASHDLRSPLVNLQGFSRQMAESVSKLDRLLGNGALADDLREEVLPLLEQDIPEALGYIDSSTRKMDRLIKGLLKISRLGRVLLHPKLVDANKLMQEVIDAMQFVITQNDASVQVDPLPPCFMDEDQLNQVCSNLLDNAIKYRSPLRAPEIRISGREVDGMVEYVFADNGLGIAANHGEIIFEVFHRLNPKDGKDGDGLGLAAVRRILERSGGRIRVESQLGSGSRFIVTVPAPLRVGPRQTPTGSN
ncbi:MAG: PAS domain S-box protein [Planctomycetes bacterium]|nr:PAS domain S-box protein [Planctomycetota bacterium]